jgi:molybdate transport system substrate-binding protein
VIGPRARVVRSRRAAGAALALLLGGCGAPTSGNGGDAAAQSPLVVAAAADLLPAFTQLGQDFERTTGQRVVFSFGSSGLLAQQLLEGAPMDLYASASATFVERLLAAGIGEPDTRTTYAFGRIVIWSTAERWNAGEGWDTLADLASDSTIRTVAIANPEHAPYGLAARQALEAAGVADVLAPRLVFGENVADAQRLVATGNADVGIIALSLAIAAGGADASGPAHRSPLRGRWVLVDAALHAPLQQDMLVVARDPQRAAQARAFVAFVASPEGRAVMRQYGFRLPQDAP